VFNKSGVDEVGGFSNTYHSLVKYKGSLPGLKKLGEKFRGEKAELEFNL
jgi:hypothetical protein